ncbi:MAG: hypothetical protein ACLRFR_02540 [Clostridia bacterium]
MINFEKKLKSELEKKDKDTIINLYLQKCYDFEVEQNQLQTQIESVESGCLKLAIELEIAKRALELACNKLDTPCGFCAGRTCPEETEDCRQCLANHFKELAKKEIENGK